MRPVEVLHVDSDAGGAVVVVVDNMPWTYKVKIGWYFMKRIIPLKIYSAPAPATSTSSARCPPAQAGRRRPPAISASYRRTAPGVPGSA